MGWALFNWIGQFLDDTLGWHTPLYEEGLTHDGASFHSRCWYCGKDIMQDSQGNWF